MQLVNGIDPGVSKTQPLATFSHRSAVIALRSSACCRYGGDVGDGERLQTQQVALPPAFEFDAVGVNQNDA